MDDEWAGRIVGCCGSMKAAQQLGTDNEGYGPLFDVHCNVAQVGSTLPAPEYCPWCGKTIAIEQGDPEEWPDAHDARIFDA